MIKHTILVGLFLVIMLVVYPVYPREVPGVAPPDELGPYHIGIYRVSYDVSPYGRYHAAIRYPAEKDGLFAPYDSSDAPFPGIVVGNGFAGSDWNIKWICRHLTSHGYITICFTPPDNKLGDTTQWAYGFEGGIDKLKSQNDRFFSPICELLDPTLFGAIGLSMGGAGCIEATGSESSEFDTVVALAPARSNSTLSAAYNITVPIQFQVGANDGMVSSERVLSYYLNFTGYEMVKEYLSITGGNHIGFIDDFFARIAEWLGLDNPHAIEVEEQHRVSSKYFTSWFHYHLLDRTEYFTYIFGDETINDLHSGTLSDLRYHIP